MNHSLLHIVLYIIIILITLHYIPSTHSKTLTIPYQLNYGKYCLNISTYYNNTQSFHIIPIDLNKNVSLFESLQSTPYTFIGNTTIPSLVPTKQIPVDIISTTISFPETPNINANSISINLTLFNINPTFTSIQTSQHIGFALTFNDHSMSVIHQLKQHGYINELSFTFNNGYRYIRELYLGKPPLTLFNKPMNKSTCIVNTTYPYVNWNCKIDYIYFTNHLYNKYNEHTLTYFNTVLYETKAPLSFVHFIKDVLLYEYVVNNRCKVEESRNAYIQCECDVLYELGEVSFVMNGLVHKFKIDEIFDIYEVDLIGEDVCELVIITNRNEDAWVFGIGFMNKYISVFNYERKEISFYSEKILRDDELTYINKAMIENIHRVIKGNCLLLIVGCLITVIAMRFNNGKRFINS